MIHGEAPVGLLGAALKGFSQRTRDFEICELQNHARGGRPPQQGLSLAVPWKNATAVGIYQAFDREICTRCQQAVGALSGGQGLRRWREGAVFTQKRQAHACLRCFESLHGLKRASPRHCIVEISAVQTVLAFFSVFKEQLQGFADC